jgi:hypothetical protein
VPFKHREYLEHNVEGDMQRKLIVGEYYDKRNGIYAASLGDKAYKAPNYAPDFYKESGLVPGSSVKNYPKNMARKKQIDFTISKQAKWPMRQRQVWSEKVKSEDRRLDVDSVLAADKWEAEREKVKEAAAAPPAKHDPKGKKK